MSRLALSLKCYYRLAKKLPPAAGAFLVTDVTWKLTRPSPLAPLGCLVHTTTEILLISSIPPLQGGIKGGGRFVGTG